MSIQAAQADHFWSNRGDALYHYGERNPPVIRIVFLAQLEAYDEGYTEILDHVHRIRRALYGKSTWAPGSAVVRPFGKSIFWLYDRASTCQLSTVSGYCWRLERHGG